MTAREPANGYARHDRMELLGYLFMAAAIVTVAIIFFGMFGNKSMPFSCPKCAFFGDADLAGQPRAWYVAYREHVRCRSCHTWFKEHPNGTLVEDHDG